MLITGKQIAVARTLLDVSQKKAASVANVSIPAISNFESGKHSLNSESLTALVRYFHNQGVEFIAGNSARFREGIRVYEGAEEFRLFYDDIYRQAPRAGGPIYVYNGVPSLLVKYLGQDFYDKHAERMTKIKDRYDFKVAIKKGDGNFIGSDLDYADVSYANLKNTNMSDSTMYSVTATYTRFDSTTMHSGYLIAANLQNAYLNYGDFYNTYFQVANMRSAYANYALFNGDGNRLTFYATDLSDAQLRYSDFQDARFRYADLKFADFEGADVSSADFNDSYWHQTIWTDGERYDTNQAD